MAFSSSVQNDDQLFISFRGKQLRYNFVSHLVDAFKRQEIRSFVDKYELRGKDLKTLLLRIENSKVALAIFSTRFIFFDVLTNSISPSDGYTQYGCKSCFEV